MTEFWRQRIQTRSMTASGIPVAAGRAPLLHVIEGPNRDADMAWLNVGKGCPSCLLKFPERPEKRWWHLFQGNEWGCDEKTAKRRVCGGCCPVCGDPVETGVTLAQSVPFREEWESPDQQLARDIAERPIGTV